MDANTMSNKKLKEVNLKEERAFNRFKALVDKVVADDNISNALREDDIVRIKTRESITMSIESILISQHKVVDVKNPLLAFYSLDDNSQQEAVKSHVLLYLTLVVDSEEGHS